MPASPFRRFLGGKGPTPELLHAFLEGNAEWIKGEYKEAKAPPEFGLRKAVCAQANTEGGDIFLGIDDGGSATGTSVSLDWVSNTLSDVPSSPAMHLEPRLATYVPNPPVEIRGEQAKKVIWIEVVSTGVPAIVKGTDGTWTMYERKGRSSEPMDAVRVTERFVQMNRTRMLTEIFSEARRVVKGIGNIPEYEEPGQMLPRFEEIYASGVWARFALRSPPVDDDNLLNDAYLGAIRGYPQFYRAMWKLHMPNDRINFWNQLRGRQEGMREAIKRLEAYLASEHIAVPP